MNLIQLTRHSDNKLYAEKIEIIIEENFNSHLISISNFSDKKLKEAISERAGILGANAYEVCGQKILDWLGEYNGSYHFYRIDESDLKIKRRALQQKIRDKQLELDFFSIL